MAVSLRRGIQVRFLPVMIFFLFSMLVASVIVVVVAYETTRRDARLALYAQMRTQVEAVMFDGDAYFSVYVDAALSAAAVANSAACDPLRSDGYAIANRQAYYDIGGDMLPTYSNDSRHAWHNHTLDHSIYTVPGVGPEGIANFTKEMNDTIAISVHADPFSKPIFEIKTEFTNLMYAFHLEGIFSIYPGASIVDQDPQRTYDPRKRAWYLYAMAHPTPGSPILTAPYRDFFSNQWMATLARQTRCRNGVVGADVLLSTMSSTLAETLYIPSGRLTVIDRSTGVVVADQGTRNVVSSDANLTYWSDLESPTFPDHIATTLLQMQVGDAQIVTDIIDPKTGVSYLFAARLLVAVAGRFQLVASVPHSAIYAPVISTAAFLRTSTLLILLINAAIFAVASAFLWVMVNVTAAQISAPLVTMRSNIEHMVRNVGHRRMFADVVDVVGGLGDTQARLNTGFNRMVESIGEQRGRTEELNPYYLGAHDHIQAPQANTSVFPMHLPYPDATKKPPEGGGRTQTFHGDDNLGPSLSAAFVRHRSGSQNSSRHVTPNNKTPQEKPPEGDRRNEPFEPQPQTEQQ